MAAQFTEDCLARWLEVDAKIFENTSGHAVSFEEQTQENMFGADAGMPAGPGFLRSQPESFLGTVSVRQTGLHFPGRKNTDPLLNLFPKIITIHPDFFPNSWENPLLQCEQAEQDMFRSDKIVMEARSFCPGEFQSPPGAWGECA